MEGGSLGEDDLLLSKSVTTWVRGGIPTLMTIQLEGSGRSGGEGGANSKALCETRISEVYGKGSYLSPGDGGGKKMASHCLLVFVNRIFAGG